MLNIWQRSINYVYFGISIKNQNTTKSTYTMKTNKTNTEKSAEIAQGKTKVDKYRHFSKRYLQSRNFLALLEKQRGEDLKLWQTLEPHYTDLLEEQLKTRKKINYLQSLANFGHTNVKRVYLMFLPVNILIFVMLWMTPPTTLYELHTTFPVVYKICVFGPLAMSLTNVPMAIFWRKIWQDISYKKIQDRLGLTIFKYFEIVEKNKHIDGGYTKKDLTSILKRFNPKLPYTQDEIANYLQQIIEVEMERKPRGVVYYLYLKEEYFDAREKKRQTDTQIATS